MEDTNKDMNIDKEEAKKVKKVKKEKKARKRGRKGRIVAQIFVCFLLTVAFVASAAGGAVAAYYKAATNTITTDTKTALKNVDVVDADLEYDPVSYTHLVLVLFRSIRQLIQHLLQ